MKRAPLVLVTAGPTREKIDPVRFISNYSTGVFGYAIAKEARRRACRVVLVSGPVCIMPPSGVKLIKVESAADMLKSVRGYARTADYIFMAAAVSDWRVLKPSLSKIKRGKGIGVRTLKLIENPDILKSIKRRKGSCLVGFALETDDLEENAMRKLRSKRMDIVVANRLGRGRGIFGDNRTDITVFDKNGGKDIHKGRSKAGLAKIILDKAFGFNIK